MNDGAPPGPDPKAARPSLVDSGWSSAPPPDAEPSTDPRLPPARPLPSYEAHEAGIHVTMVDREVQTRAQAMREKDTLPPPRRASEFPAAFPPPPAARAPEQPPVIVRQQDPLASPLPRASRPPPPPSRPSAPPPKPSAARPSMPPARPSAPPAQAVALAADAQSVAAARSAATLVRPRSNNPPPLPSFGAALAQRVRFAGGEVPLWSLVTPLVLLVALGTAFAAAAVTSASDPTAAQPSLTPSAEPSASAAHALPAPTTPPEPTPSTTPSAEEKPKPLTLLERVALGDDAAVKELSGKPVAELNVEEAISLSLGQSAQDVRAARALRDRVDHDPGLIKDPDVLSQLRRYSDDPETARDALSAMANVPGPISADLIYEVWTATSSRTTATDLARSLIYAKEVRAKASPALAVALDLRDADTCEKNRDLLERASADGDRRVFHLLGKLTRKYGCGANKRADCYACLRSGTDLDAAMKAVKARREPHPFGG